MLLWRSDRLQKEAWGFVLWPQTKRGRQTHGRICIHQLEKHLDLPQTELDVWLELHNRPATDRLKLTTGPEHAVAGGYHYIRIEGNWWSWLRGNQQRLLDRLGLIGGPRDCLWLEVWYREVNHA